MFAFDIGVSRFEKLSPILSVFPSLFVSSNYAKIEERMEP